MSTALRQLRRGIAARRWSSLALLLTGALTVAAATIGPLYARAARESVLHDQLTSQPADATGLHVALLATDVSQAQNFTTAEQAAPAAHTLAAYPTRIEGARFTAGVVAPDSDQPAQQTRMVWRDGACAQLVVVGGRCPTGTGEAMISARLLAGPYGYRLGGTMVLPGTGSATAGGPGVEPEPASVRIVGVYRPKDPTGGFWFGTRYFDAAIAFRDGQPDTVDAVFVQRATLAGFVGASGEIDLDYPLDPDAVRLSDVDDVTAAVRGLTGRRSANPTFVDPLPGVLAAIAPAEDQVGTGSLLVSLQLAALALLVLFAATADALDGRGGDVALAKLRGLAPRATLRFLLAEPVALLLAAVPLGALIGTAATRLLARALLVGGVPVVFPGAGTVAAAAAFAGAVLAAGVAGRRVVTRSVLDQWRGTQHVAGRGRRALVLDLVLAVAAALGLVLLTTGRGGSTALLAPGLLVLAVALLGVRLLPLAVRVAVPLTRASPRLGGYLAVRQVGRRPAALRLAVLLAVAIGLAVFAVGGESIASTNRTHRAHVEVGAPRTVGVQFAPEADPVALSRRADPDGRWAVVAATWLPDGGQTVSGTVLGVDPRRLAAVAWPTTDGPSTATVAHDIGPAVPPAVLLTGTTVQMTVTASDLTGVAPFVDIVVQPVQRAPTTVRLGTLRTGTAVYSGAVPCASTCRVAGFGWERPVSSFDDIGGTTTVSGLTASDDGATFSPVDLGLADDRAWKAQSPDGTDGGSTGEVSVSAAGVREVFTSTGGSSAGIGRVQAPSTLPVWAGSGAVITPPAGDNGVPGVPQVLDANSIAYPVHVVGTTAAVPGVAREAVIADVSSLRSELPSFTAEATWSVWLGAYAPPDALARLAAAGLQPGAVTTTTERVERLSRQGPALALAVLLACAVAAAVLAIGATATAIAAGGRRRAFELAALRVIGVPRGALSRAMVLEQLALLGTAVLLGVPSGVVAAVIAMPVIPQFSDASPLPLVDVPSVAPVVAIAAAFVVLLTLTAVTAGVLLVRSAVPSRLREAAA